MPSEDKEYNTDHINDGYEQPPSIINIDPTPAGPPSQNAEQRPKKAKSFIQKLRRPIPILTVVIAGAAIGQCVVTYWQLDSMNKQVAEMKSNSGQTDKLIDATKRVADAAKTQSDNTRVLADAAKDQVDKLAAQVIQTHSLASAASRQATIAENTFTEVNRPYVGIEAISVRQMPEISQMGIEIGLKNFGAGVAQDLISNMVVKIDGLPIHGLDYNATDIDINSSREDLFPTATRTLPVRISNPTYTDVIFGRKTLDIELVVRYSGHGIT